MILMVALGGAIGSSFRYMVGVAATRLFGIGFPWGTLDRQYCRLVFDGGADRAVGPAVFGE